jgi:hypothetical protein
VNFPIQDQFAAEYMALREVGASHAEAVDQIAKTHEVEAAEVEAA